MPATDPQVVILCGGLGTRIRDVADDIPKPMISGDGTTEQLMLTLSNRVT
jgi:choline kinase